MAKIWDVLFASAGDKQVIPVPVEPDGSVSVTQGWTTDYELPNTDPSYKPVGREEMNGAFYEVTDSIRQLQLQGAAEWSALLGSYPKGAEVIHAGERWFSPVAGNTTEPGAVGATWLVAGTIAAASETVAGIAEIATQAETDTGTDDTRFVTPLKLFGGRLFTTGSDGYLKLPSWLGGFIFQWGQISVGSGGSTLTFPIAFPTAQLTCVAMAGDTGNPWVTYSLPTPTKIDLKTWNTAGMLAAPVRWFSVGR